MGRHGRQSTMTGIVDALPSVKGEWRGGGGGRSSRLPRGRCSGGFGVRVALSSLCGGSDRVGKSRFNTDATAMSSTSHGRRATAVTAAVGLAGVLGAVVAVGLGQRTAAAASRASGRAAAGLRFEITFPASASAEPQTGHIILIVSK